MAIGLSRGPSACTCFDKRVFSGAGLLRWLRPVIGSRYAIRKNSSGRTFTRALISLLDTTLWRHRHEHVRHQACHSLRINFTAHGFVRRLAPFKAVLVPITPLDDHSSQLLPSCLPVAPSSQSTARTDRMLDKAIPQPQQLSSSSTDFRPL
jgi:hypothetical protein